MSEIDDIFAKRPVASTSAIVPLKKKQRTKDKHVPEKSASAPAASSKKRPAPETILDPSTRPPPQKKSKVDKPAIVAGSEKDDTERFKDSRGSGPRRKTEEGWSIYKEDELGIGDDGGGVLHMPFFSLPHVLQTHLFVHLIVTAVSSVLVPFFWLTHIQVFKSVHCFFSWALSFL
ncbi:hypothetical protein DFH07DRAFT_1054787 [Mycena maculata]|uniref:Uncharacterized protein n=1 Tax=Mycena maculata TaxID=230809 RepID=A0AAD7KDV5_9AGAR|nr:hypothetical protein DFH07DRAFT_1054787 [Mycena maculata]